MGCSGSALSNPFPENICGDSDTIGDEIPVSNACFFTTDIGHYCGDAGGFTQTCFGAINGSTEWIDVGAGEGCGVCSSCNGLDQGDGNGLCGFGSGSCSWAGVRQQCRRVAFNGNPLKCCRRSRFIQGNDLFCFDDNFKHSTCQPQHRGFLQPACTSIMATYCSDDTEEPFAGKWIGTPGTRDCRRFVQENAGKLDFYGPVIEAMITRYLITENNPITSPETHGASHDPFINTIIEVCRENPGACDTVLETKCAGITRGQLSANVNLANLCGCFMPDIEYASLSEFGIEKECDPVCVLGSSVHLHDTTTNDPARFLKCNQSICVIDDVTINILAKSVVGDITFAQACGSCAGEGGDGSCRCYINDTSIAAVNSLIGDVSFEQQCGGGALCHKSAPVVGAPPIQVDCDTGETQDSTGETSSSASQNTTRNLWIIVGILGAILLILLLFNASRREPQQPILVAGRPEKPTRPLLGSVRPAGNTRPLLTRPT